MSNSLFNLMNCPQNSTNNQINNLINQFSQFRSTFSGNPQMQVQNLLQSGQMSQEQFNQLAQMATKLRSLI